MRGKDNSALRVQKIHAFGGDHDQSIGRAQLGSDSGGGLTFPHRTKAACGQVKIAATDNYLDDACMRGTIPRGTFDETNLR